MAQKSRSTEYDSVYFLKILLYLLLGSVWGTTTTGTRFLPLGLILGVIIVQHERLQIDRKIEYAILLIASVLGLVGIGLAIRF
jgi:hypothetical protein